MRYAPAERLLSLLLELEGARIGLTIDEIASRFHSSRRTAERLLAAARGFLPDLESADEGRTRRWRLPRRQLRATSAVGFPDIDAEDLAALSLAARVLGRDKLELPAERLRRLQARLRATMGERNLLKADPDFEAMVESEGLVLRPGPRHCANSSILKTLRLALLTSSKLRLRYRYSNGRARQEIVRPYGLLYGNSHYLVAFNENSHARAVRNFRLSNIEAAEPLGIPFRRPKRFDLEQYASRSFGAFQEKPIDVVWLFHADAAKRAREFVFHASQTFYERRDGSLEVHFRAGSLLEMAWHLVTWGDSVVVVRPLRLRRIMVEMCGWLAEHHDRQALPTRDHS